MKTPWTLLILVFHLHGNFSRIYEELGVGYHWMIYAHYITIHSKAVTLSENVIRVKRQVVGSFNIEIVFSYQDRPIFFKRFVLAFILLENKSAFLNACLLNKVTHLHYFSNFLILKKQFVVVWVIALVSVL